MIEFFTKIKYFFISLFSSKQQQTTAPSPPDKPSDKTLCQIAYEIANQEIGVAETPGSDNNPRILEYESACDLDESIKGDELSWCSCFVNWCVKKAGGTGTRNAMAKSWLYWGKKVFSPKPGDIVVFWRNTPTADTGHVAFYVSEYNENVFVLGGNQSNKVCIEQYPKSRILAFRRSLDEPS